MINVNEKDSFTPPDVQRLAEMIESTLTGWTSNDVPVLEPHPRVGHLALGLAYQSREFWKQKSESTVNRLRHRRNFWRDRSERAERALCAWWNDPDNPPAYAAAVNSAPYDWKAREDDDV